jgi:hypothetical protein
MYSWSKNWPTLTELFFGKGNGPQGKLNGMTAEKPKAKWTSKRGTGIEDIEEVKIVASIIKPKKKAKAKKSKIKNE